MWVFRLFVYVAGIGAGGLALSGYADYDPATWTLDIHPFNVREFVLSAVSTVSSALAAVATISGWRRK